MLRSCSTPSGAQGKVHGVHICEAWLQKRRTRFSLSLALLYACHVLVALTGALLPCRSYADFLQRTAFGAVVTSCASSTDLIRSTITPAILKGGDTSCHFGVNPDCACCIMHLVPVPCILYLLAFYLETTAQCRRRKTRTRFSSPARPKALAW